MTNTEIAETYFEAYRSKDLRKALLAPDVTMQHAVTPRKLVGKDTVIDYMLALMRGLDDIKIERHLAGWRICCNDVGGPHGVGQDAGVFGLSDFRWADQGSPGLL